MADLETLIKDLDSFLTETKIENQKASVLTLPEPKASDTPEDSADDISREIVGAVLGSLPENVSTDVLGAKLLEATVSITESAQESQDAFKKITQFFEGVAKKCRCLRAIAAEMAEDDKEIDESELQERDLGNTDIVQVLNKAKADLAHFVFRIRAGREITVSQVEYVSDLMDNALKLLK